MNEQRIYFNLSKLKTEQGKQQLEQVLTSPQFDAQGFKVHESLNYKDNIARPTHAQILQHLLVKHAGTEKFDFWCDFITTFTLSFGVTATMGKINPAENVENLEVFLIFRNHFEESNTYDKFLQTAVLEYKNDMNSYIVEYSAQMKQAKLELEQQKKQQQEIYNQAKIDLKNNSILSHEYQQEELRRERERQEQIEQIDGLNFFDE